jgi:hypothetical protein
VLDVTIEPSLSSTDPVGSVVVVNPRPCGHEAEEDMLRRSDDDAHVPVPDDQIARLRVRDSLKLLDSVVEIVGAGIGVGKAGAFVNRMNQMRTVVPGIASDFGIKCS